VSPSDLKQKVEKLVCYLNAHYVKKRIEETFTMSAAHEYRVPSPFPINIYGRTLSYLFHPRYSLKSKEAGLKEFHRNYCDTFQLDAKLLVKTLYNSLLKALPG